VTTPPSFSLVTRHHTCKSGDFSAEITWRRQLTFERNCKGVVVANENNSCAVIRSTVFLS
jgi:hypothetical protein